MLGKRPIGYRVGQFFRVPDGLAYMNVQRWMPLADVLHHFRQIPLQMSALGQKQRYHGDVACAVLDQFLDGRLESGVHAFQEREFDASGGLLLAQALDDSVKRFCPRRIARAMRKKNNGGTGLLAHIERVCGRIAFSVADLGTDRSVAAG